MSDTTARNPDRHKSQKAKISDTPGRVASGIGHEFNNILCVIKGHCELLTDADLPETAHECANEILQVANRAENLIRQFVLYSGRQRLIFEAIDLNSLVDKTLQKVDGPKDSSSVALSVQLAAGLPLVRGDRAVIEQTLATLILNARDAMPRGGALKITSDLQPSCAPADSSVQNPRMGDMVRVSISDTGAAISAENMPHVFEPFFGYTRAGKPNGLGLATANSAAQQHSGRIEVQSGIGTETVFTLYLPLAQAL